MISEVRRLIQEGKSSELVSKYAKLPDEPNRHYFFCDEEDVIRVHQPPYRRVSVRCNLCVIIDEALVCRCSNTLSQALRERHTSSECEFKIRSLADILAAFVANGYSQLKARFEECALVLIENGANPLACVSVVRNHREEFMSTTPMNIAISYGHNIDRMIDTYAGDQQFKDRLPELLLTAFVNRQTRSFTKLMYTGHGQSILRSIITKAIRVFFSVLQDHLYMIDMVMYASSCDGWVGIYTNEGISRRNIELVSSHLRTFHQRVTLRKMAFIRLHLSK